jgi:hypothetical protein
MQARPLFALTPYAEVPSETLPVNTGLAWSFESALYIMSAAPSEDYVHDYEFPAGHTLDIVQQDGDLRVGSCLLNFTMSHRWR